ncbi:MAG: hypothetical protein IKP20_04670 [Candidatus Methanomethylophilaceae archaeon]|nr:hypothetical protein [Candidatus Methanomethylophilaceae archaeon]
MRVDLLCSWGGHLQEMMELKGAWEAYNCRFITYESVRTDDLEEPKFLLIPPWKSRFRFILSLARLLPKVLFDKPDVLISTGMGHADIFLFPLCKFLGAYTIYIESGANVTELSGSASFIRRFCDRFIVRWESLAEQIGAEYHGGIF